MNNLRKNSLLICMTAMLVALGACSTAPTPSDEGAGVETQEKVPSDPMVVERGFKDSELVPLGNSATLGDPDAPVVIVEFMSLQCPFCARGAETLRDLKLQYPDDIQVVFKHLPSQTQPQALNASRVIEAARKQDAFWEMRDGILDRMSDLNTMSAQELGEELAREMDLDVEQLRADLEDPAIDERIQADVELAQKLGARGTPNYFINGIQVTGAQPLYAFEEVVQFILMGVAEMDDAGVPREDQYAVFVEQIFEMKEAYEEAAREASEPSGPTLAEARAGDLIYGEQEDYLVTIVEFSSLECPFCSRASRTLRKLEERYEGEVRFVFKNFPLSNHKNSPRAGRAIYAANQQEEGQKMLHMVYDNQGRLGQEDILQSFAEELELDMDRFMEDFESEAARDLVSANRAYGLELGVQGTPAFFVNGHLLTGAQPESEFAQIIDAEIERAKVLRDEEGLRGEELYRALVDRE